MPQFPQTLHEEVHSACFLGRILEPGMSLQAKEGKNRLQDGIQALDGRGPKLGGSRTSGFRSATVALARD